MSRIPTLDGWRAVAILLVTMHHCAMGLYPAEDAYWVNSHTLFGAFGVDIFFGLSGFLITSTLLAERRGTGRISLRSFYWRRACRILPAYLLLLAAISMLGLWRSRAEVLGCLLFFRNYVPAGMVTSVTQPLWSLAVEEHFYLLWPALMIVAARSVRAVAGGLALGFGAWRMIESQAGLGLFPLVPPHFRTDLRLDALLWGAVVAFLVSEKAAQFKGHALAWIGVASAAITCVMLYSMLSSVILACLIPAVIAATAANPRWIVSRVLELPPLAWIGRLSYGLYLWQGVLLIPQWNRPHQWWRQFPVNLIALFAVAIASYYLVETPLRRWGRLALPKLEMKTGQTPEKGEEPSMAKLDCSRRARMPRNSRLRGPRPRGAPPRRNSL